MASAASLSSPQELPYRRLPGRGRRTSGCISVGATISTIWLASDHLLVRESVYGFSETYKRFYFRDIQAIIVRRTQKWIAWIVAWTFCALLFLFWYKAAGWRSAVLGYFWPGLCLFLAMIQLVRGPSCVTHLVSAVQRELLASLNTVRKARRVLKVLVPLIEEKQGKFEPETPGTPRPAIVANPSLPRDRLIAMTPPAARAGRPPGQNRIHSLLFMTTLAGGAAALWETYRSSAIAFSAALILLGAIIVLSVIALVYQGRRRIKKSMATITWTIMVGYIVAWMIIFSAYTMIHSFQQMDRRVDKQKPPRFIQAEMTTAALRRMPGFDYVLLIYGACSAVLGIAGIGAIFLGRPMDWKEPPPLPGQTG
jgi:NADH:ubiquinone oxidoreductase subunit 6 (subunit J)